MALMVLGLALFMATHFFKRIGLRPALVSRLGENPYRGLYSLLSLVGLILIVVGYRSVDPANIHYFAAPSPTLLTLNKGLMLVAVFFLVSSNVPGFTRYWVVHPLLIGVLLWSSAHLLVNLDSRSLLLFGSFWLWSLSLLVWKWLADGRPSGPSKSWIFDVIAVVMTLGLVFLMVKYHQYLSGIPLM